MKDTEALAFYNHAFSRARQSGGGGQETPHQIAHVAAIQACIAVGGGEGTAPEPQEIPLHLQPEDPSVSHQRRLSASTHWLRQGDRRARIAAMPTFTHVTDGFAAGGVYEREYLAGNANANERATEVLAATENEIHERLGDANNMTALLDALHDIVGVDTRDELIAHIQTLVTAAEPAPEPAPEPDAEPAAAEPAAEPTPSPAQ